LEAATKARRIAPARSSRRCASTRTATLACWCGKARLRLDDARSWVVLSEWNEFVWPGPDLRRLPGATDGSVAYGVLPAGLFAVVRDRFLAIVDAGSAQRVPRS
jgi:hypothetical protein